MGPGHVLWLSHTLHSRPCTRRAGARHQDWPRAAPIPPPDFLPDLLSHGTWPAVAWPWAPGSAVVQKGPDWTEPSPLSQKPRG